MPREFAPIPRVLRWLAAIAVLVVPTLAHATAVDAFYERAVMTAADQHCRLFSPELGSALQAAEAQARGAALRSGANGATITSRGCYERRRRWR